MKYRRFGNGSLTVSAIGLGCMSMSGLRGPSDDGLSIATIHRALELGVNFLDTSTSYGSGHNQELIGRALHGRRDQAVVHSKFGSRRDQTGKPSESKAGPDRVRADCEASLKRFGFDVIDIWCPSRVDPGVPIEETVGAMSRLVEDGKVRFLGLSEAAPETIRRANAVHPIVSLQMECSLFTRDVEGGNLAACREFGMGLMAYGPLCKGLLAGVFDKVGDIPDEDQRKRAPRFQPGNFEANMEFVGRLARMAEEKGATGAQLALAWLLARGDDICPIPGVKSITHLEDNLKALDIELTSSETARLDEAFPADIAAGPRYGEAQMDRVNR